MSSKYNIDGFKKFQESLNKKPVVKVGILAGSKPRKGVTTNYEIGLKHEFGKDGMPVRSFLRMPLNMYLNKYLGQSNFYDKDTFEKDVKEKSIVSILKKIGVISVRVIMDAFGSNGFGQWAPWRGGYRNKTGNILVDTRELRDSIIYEVEKK